MRKDKPASDGHTKKNTAVSLVRSSAAEYLTFVAASGQGGVEAVYVDENVWLTQKMMGLLYDVATHTINHHLKKVFADSELQAGSVIRNFRISAADGKSYDTQHYSGPAARQEVRILGGLRSAKNRGKITHTRSKSEIPTKILTKCRDLQPDVPIFSGFRHISCRFSVRTLKHPT